VTHWVHGDHVLFSGQKMAKSAGNVWTLDTVEELGAEPLDFRYLCLTSRYRRQLRFSPDALTAAHKARARLRQALAGWGSAASGLGPAAKEWAGRFREAILDDLDFPRALTVVWALAGEQGSALPGAQRAALLSDWDAVLGLGLAGEAEETAPELPAGAAELLGAREAARGRRDWAESDRLRDELAGLGVEVADTRDGQTWHLS
jgi:cysteinyl-tRNA synthetase